MNAMTMNGRHAAETPPLPDFKPMRPGVARTLATAYVSGGRAWVPSLAFVAAVAAVPFAFMVHGPLSDGSEARAPLPAVENAGLLPLPGLPAPDAPEATPEPGVDGPSAGLPSPVRIVAPSPVVTPEVEAAAPTDEMFSVRPDLGSVPAVRSGRIARPAPAAEDPGFEVRIVDREGELSGFWRTDGDDEQHFLVVEAVDAAGRPREWEVTDMDTGRVARVSKWAVRVEEADFARLAAEKAVSGTIPDALAGRRAAGAEGIEWTIGAKGESLVEWEEEQR